MMDRYYDIITMTGHVLQLEMYMDKGCINIVGRLLTQYHSEFVHCAIVEEHKLQNLIRSC